MCNFRPPQMCNLQPPLTMGYFEIYRRRFPRGRVELDGNSARGSDWGDEGRSHYIVAVVPE